VVRLEVAVFLNVTPCNLVYGSQRIEGTYVRQKYHGVAYTKTDALKMEGYKIMDKNERSKYIRPII
jgi:hypothetical protein